ncbi:MAG: hypothetical protein J6C93_01245 [Clostridia bacterium]|nr:hypothetical protein [Clostridia bacterium]
MAKKQRSEGAAKNSLVRICCYVALILAAVLILVYNVLPLIGVNIGGKVIGALSLVKDIALLLGIGFGAYAFAASHGKAAKIVFWIALVVYVASAICGLF